MRKQAPTTVAQYLASLPEERRDVEPTPLNRPSPSA
jgi:hypothetical protein